ncbi:hypothetical protein H4S07_003759 [Coemansia furcata]|uniref:Uncharacterized protein n=1 Tax=Coemansia furcata TaxID=417177 RepID=A0ACC1LDR6_9FUNG|nr:hypothetical protein H4S07_003759 [Coemansia furcata]
MNATPDDLNGNNTGENELNGPEASDHYDGSEPDRINHYGGGSAGVDDDTDSSDADSDASSDDSASDDNSSTSSSDADSDSEMYSSSDTEAHDANYVPDTTPEDADPYESDRDHYMSADDYDFELSHGEYATLLNNDATTLVNGHGAMIPDRVVPVDYDGETLAGEDMLVD